MQRSRTPFGAVPISTIYGYEYPLANDSEVKFSKDSKKEIHSEYNSSWDYSTRSARAMSEVPMGYLSTTSDIWGSPTANLYYMPTALRDARSRSASPFEWVSSPITRVEFPRLSPAPEVRSTTTAYSGTTPWNSTGFYYSPRYPQAYRGTAATTVPYARRYMSKFDLYYPEKYPAKRFIPSYVPLRYGRRYL